MTWVNLLLTLATIIIISWTVGLTPSLLLRYAIHKKPVSRKTANWIAGLIVSIMFVATIALEVSLSQNSKSTPNQAPNIVGFILLFYASRWVLERPQTLPTQERSKIPSSRPLPRPANEQRP